MLLCTWKMMAFVIRSTGLLCLEEVRFMGWERRNDTIGLYFYRSRRTPEGKVVKEYFGCGERANAAALKLAHSKAQEKADRHAVWTERSQLANLDRLDFRVC